MTTFLLISCWGKSSELRHCAENTKKGDWKLIREYPHDQNSFTQGLQVDKKNSMHYFESSGRYGKSFIKKLDLISGDTLIKTDIDPKYFAEGLSVVDGKIVLLTWHKKTAFWLSRDSLQIENTQNFRTRTGQGWGVAFIAESNQLVVSDGSEYLHFLDPKTLEEKETTKVINCLPEHLNTSTLDNLNELEWNSKTKELYANVWKKDFILSINPFTGEVIRYYDLSNIKEEHRDPDSVLNGIALLHDRSDTEVIVTGKLWKNLYHLKLLH